MYIEAVPNRGSPPAILLRQSLRENGRVRKRTLANLSDWPTTLVEGFRTLLKGGVAVAEEGIRIRRALPHGHAAAVLGTIRAIGLDRLLGRPTDKRLAPLAIALIASRAGPALAGRAAQARQQTHRQWRPGPQLPDPAARPRHLHPQPNHHHPQCGLQLYPGRHPNPTPGPSLQSARRRPDQAVASNTARPSEISLSSQ